MENNNKQSKSNKKTALIILLLLIVIIAVILATFAWAKYITSVDGEATAEVAKWNVTAEAGSAKFSKTFNHVVEGKMAPGTDGTFTAGLNINDTEVDVEYTVTLVSVEPVDANSVVPKNLVIKDVDGNIVYKNNAIVATSDDTDGVVAKGVIKHDAAEADRTISKSFTWEWPYETPATADKTVDDNNAQDTEDGKKAGSFKITYRIDASQVEPVADTTVTP